MSIKYNLPPTIATTRHIEICIDRAVSMRAALQQHRIAKVVGKSKTLDEIHVDPLLEDFLNHNQVELDEKLLDEIIVYFEKIFHDAPVFTVTTANLVSEGHAAKLTSWFRGEISPVCLMRFKVRRSLLGGILLGTPSKQLDLSARKRILETKSALREAIRGV